MVWQNMYSGVQHQAYALEANAHGISGQICRWSSLCTKARAATALQRCPCCAATQGSGQPRWKLEAAACPAMHSCS